MTISSLLTLARRNVGLTALVAAALFLVALNPFFYFGWQSAGDLQAELEKEEMVATVQLMQAQEKYGVASLQAELDGLERDIDDLAKSNRFPEEVPGADLYAAMANVAGWNGVTLVSLSSVISPGTEAIGENAYNKAEINMSVAGVLSNIRSFLTSMEEGSYPSLRFQDVNLTKSESGQNWEGDLTVVVLSQP